MRRGGRRRGFTLMETLVMLLLVSFSATLAFQMLGAYRIARERSLIQGERLDVRAAVEEWFAETVRGLHPVGATPLRGDDGGFSGITLNPVFRSPGIATEFAWRLDGDFRAGWTVAYSEAGQERFTVPLPVVEQAHFIFLDAEGNSHPRWPPASGGQSGLPTAVAWYRRDGDGRGGTRVAAVLGPLLERIEPYQHEEIE